MIIPMANGWRDETSEGPCNLLISKGDWEVHQSKPNSFFWAVNEGRNLEFTFTTEEEAKKFVDDFIERERKDK